MKEQAIQKINKVGKISYAVAVICKILLIAALVCSLVGAVIWLKLPESTVKVTQSGTMTVEMNQEGIGASQSELKEMQEALEAGEQLQVNQVTNGIMNSGFELTLSNQTYIPTDMEVTEDSVIVEMISEDNSFSMRAIAGILMSVSVVMIMSIITLTFVESLCKAFRDCESPFEEAVIKKMHRLAICLIPWTLVSSIGDSITNSIMHGGLNWTVSIDLGVVLVVLIVLILVYIFKYGAVLQQESDETL